MAADGQLDECTAAMGKDLGVEYEYLLNETAWLHMKWGQYQALFGKDQATFNALMHTAEHLFKMLDYVMWTDLLMHVTRLTGPKFSMGKSNMTIRNLSSLVQNSAISSDLRRLEEVAIDKCSFALPMRNKLLAHLDRSQVLGAAPIAHAGSRMQMSAALGAIAEVLNFVSKKYLGSSTAFDLCYGFGEADDLLLVLDAGHKLLAQRRIKPESLPAELKS